MPCRRVPRRRCAGLDGAFCGIHVVDAIADAAQTEDMTSRRIVFLIFDGLQPLDLAGPHEVFSQAGVLSPDAGYVCQVAAGPPARCGRPAGCWCTPRIRWPISTRPASTP